MNRWIFLYILCVLSCSSVGLADHPQGLEPAGLKPVISFTFDDGLTGDMPGYALEAWNGMLLEALEKHHLKSVLFAKGSSLEGVKGEYVLSSWDRAGHKIANHTYAHQSYSNAKVTLEEYQSDFLKNDSIVRRYENFYPYFRFPYLKEGNTAEKVNGFRQFLAAQGYCNGHVTIDASDWYLNGRLVDRLKQDPKADIAAYRQFYIEHMYDRALFYDSLATALTNRKIRHTILLHHNLAAALFLDDLIEHFKANGWQVINADEAFKDPFFRNEPTPVPAGESLVWALAKQSGRYEHLLRYPAEDGAYEKAAMDSLGL